MSSHKKCCDDPIIEKIEGCVVCLSCGHYYAQNSNACCENPSLEVRDGQLICISCGTVSGRKLEDKRRRMSNESSWHYEVFRKYSSGTEFGSRVDHSGRNLSPKRIAKFADYKKHNLRYTNNISREIIDFEKRAKSFCRKYGLPKRTNDLCEELFKHFVPRRSNYRIAKEYQLAVLLFISARKHKVPVTKSEIMSGTGAVDTKYFNNALKIIIKELFQGSNAPLKKHKGFPPNSPEHYLPKGVEELDLPYYFVAKAIECFDKIRKSGYNLDGKNPKGLTGALLYFFARHRKDFKWVKKAPKITLAKVKQIFGVSQVTVIERHKELKKLHATGVF